MLSQENASDAIGSQNPKVKSNSQDVVAMVQSTQNSDASKEVPLQMNNASHLGETDSPPTQESRSLFYAKVGYFITLASASVIAGFSFTVNQARKNNSKQTIHEEGFALARKALLRGSIYSITGFCIFCTTSYQLFGKEMISNFNAKAKKNDDEDLKYLESLLK